MISIPPAIRESNERSPVQTEFFSIGAQAVCLVASDERITIFVMLHGTPPGCDIKRTILCHLIRSQTCCQFGILFAYAIHGKRGQWNDVTVWM